jgi:Cof subfamily protein (haloacid dehalogenase superfamily)
MKKLLFFDVDGTLYNSKKQLPQSAKEAIWQARENGHEIAIATGRAPFMIQDLLDELQIDTYVTFNGQYVVHKGKVIFTDQIPINELQQIVAFGQSSGHPFVFINEREMIANTPNHTSITDSLATIHFPYPQIDANYYLQQPVYQTLLFAQQHEQRIYEEKFPTVQFIRWHEFSCDMLPAQGSKARGIQKLVEHLNVSMEDVIAFGDGLNDLEMLRSVGFSVAMGNGHEKAKVAASFIAEHVDEDGLAKSMRALKLI